MKCYVSKLFCFLLISPLATYDKVNLHATNLYCVVMYIKLYNVLTHISYFIGSGYLEIVKVLIDNGAIVDYCTEKKSTPLRAACYLGRADIVKYLIENGANVNITNIFNSTCLMIASYKGIYI